MYRFMSSFQSWLGKPRISILSTRNVICTFGGGGLTAVTFLCKTSWKNSIVFFKSFNISESSLQNITKKQLDTKTSLYIRIIPSLVDGLSVCI